MFWQLLIINLMLERKLHIKFFCQEFKIKTKQKIETLRKCHYLCSGVSTVIIVSISIKNKCTVISERASLNIPEKSTKKIKTKDIFIIV